MSVASCTLLIVLTIPIDISSSASHVASAKEHLSASTAEEHVKDIVGVKLLFVKSILLLIALLEIFFRTMLVIEFALFRLTQAGISSVNLLEGFICLRSVVLIRVEFQSKLSVSFFELIFSCSFRKT